MLPLRSKVPERRKITRQVSKWSDHKEDLRIDFNNRCAYCDSFDGFRHTYFEVDHFIPKVFFLPLGNIGLTQYSNLVYSCKFCNNTKLNKWPTRSETNHNDGKVGFVDPCDVQYDSHFYRTTEGAIMWKTELGKWMHTKAFRFDERERGIRLLWNMNKLLIIIKELQKVVEKYADDTEEYRTLHAHMSNYSCTYVQYHIELMNYYN